MFAPEEMALSFGSYPADVCFWGSAVMGVDDVMASGDGWEGTAEVMDRPEGRWLMCGRETCSVRCEWSCVGTGGDPPTGLGE